MPNFTEKAIAASFVKLLNERPLDEITVKDIVEDCGVNRKTFYYHYQDIYDLLEKLVREETEKALSQGDFDSWEDGLTALAEFAFMNKRAVYHIFNSSGREYLEDYLRSISEKLMRYYVRNKLGAGGRSEEDVKLLCDFYATAMAGMAVEWIKRGMKEEQEETIKKLGRLLKGTVTRALENCNIL